MKKRKKPTSIGASRGGYSDKPKKKSAEKPITSNRRKGFAGGKRPYDYSVYEKEEATIEYMQRLFDKHEFEVNKTQLEQFWEHYQLLSHHNASLDLTRIMGIEATVLKHFIDSAIVGKYIDIEGPILDIGSGPGFPGVPLAICYPEAHVILAESRGKRVKFLEMVKENLKLTNTSIYAKSVREDSELEASLIVTRALEKIPASLRRVKPLLKPLGRIAFLKGPNCGQEVTEAQEGFKGIYKMCDDIRYSLPGSASQKRRLVVFQLREGA